MKARIPTLSAMAAATASLLVLRRGIVHTLLAAGATVTVALPGGPVPH